MPPMALSHTHLQHAGGYRRKVVGMYVVTKGTNRVRVGGRYTIALLCIQAALARCCSLWEQAEIQNNWSRRGESSGAIERSPWVGWGCEWGAPSQCERAVDQMVKLSNNKPCELSKRETILNMWWVLNDAKEAKRNNTPAYISIQVISQA